MDKTVLKEFQKIPTVGIETAKDLWHLGFRSIDELRGRNPDDLYQQLSEIQERKLDRCVLYVFRYLVYYAETDVHDPDKLKWWAWKDSKSL